MSPLILTRADIRALLTLDDCIGAVEEAFRQHAAGAAVPPGVLSLHAADGAFHIKAAGVRLPGAYFAAKVNANFPHNAARHALPTIQGVLLLADLGTGAPLAIMDSGEITTLRTGAATAVAARHLALPGPLTVTVAGCGVQGRVQLRALAAVRPLARVYACDAADGRAAAFAAEMGPALGVDVRAVTDVRAAVRASDVVVTCTTATQAYVLKDDVRAGAFIAAVGADNPHKQEIAPHLLAAASVVVDVLDQAATLGDLHHAIEAGLMTRADVRAELGAIVVGSKPGRQSADEIIIFDSTGMALQDVTAAALAYERAVARGAGTRVSLAD